MNMNLAGMHGLVLPENYTGDVKQQSVSAVCMYVCIYVCNDVFMYVCIHTPNSTPCRPPPRPGVSHSVIASSRSATPNLAHAAWQDPLPPPKGLGFIYGLGYHSMRGH